MTTIQKTIALLLSVLVWAASVAAQEHITVEWKLALRDLERDLTHASPELWRANAESLRNAIASFAAAHPGIDAPAPLPERPDRDAMERQLEALKTAVDAAIRQAPGTPFNLGRVSVTVTASAVQPSLVASSIEKEDIDSHNFVNVAKALDSLPGVSIQHLATNRNEAGVMVRGFSSRGQVPLYLDGVPVYVPYDGYVDFNRFLTSDIAEIQATRGYSSPLLGPNALGGSLNLVTKEPSRPIEGDLLVGAGSGDQFLSSLRLGGRRSRFFVQGSLDWLQTDFIPLSGEFPVQQYKNLPHLVMTDELNHSASRDEKFSGRAGWTPRRNDEYVFSYSSQKGKKGVPLYQGPNTAAVFRNFWEWPYWNTNGYYFHSNTGIGEDGQLKLRAFYNQFRNSINMYSDDTYAVMNTKNAQHSMYDEHTEGVSAEYSTRAIQRNSIGVSFFLKNDTHAEHGVYPAVAPFPLVQPRLTDKDRQVSIGLQDAITLLPQLRVTAGFSADHLAGIQAQSYNTALSGLIPFTCLSSPANTSFSGCTAHVWSFNPQISVSYGVGDTGSLFLTFADRGRFPMLKDTYSSGMGSGLPNPDLRPEHSRNWNVGYSQVFGASTVVKAVLFRSDLRDAIESVYITDSGGFCPNSKIPGLCSQMANIGQEVHQGVELEVRSAPIKPLTIEASYSYLNRTIAYDFAGFANVNRVSTSVITLPALPKNKLIGSATAQLPHRVMTILTARYEGGITLQDTTFASASPLYLPRGESYATVDLGVIAPVRYGISLQAGVKNVFDRNYYYTAGYPEIGRNWFFNLRFQFR